MPPARSSSARPATKGTSGPTTTKSMLCSEHHLTTCTKTLTSQYWPSLVYATTLSDEALLSCVLLVLERFRGK